MTLTAADYQRFCEHGGLADLRVRAKFRLTGADRVRYLNGQVTANVTKLRPGEAAPACVTTAKGKLCGEVVITATPEALFLDAEPELREPLFARLERYIIADDAVLEDVTDEYALLHALDLKDALPEDFGAPVRVRRFGREGRDYWFATGENATVFPTARAIVAPELLELLRIEAGVPRWGRELTEETLPPEAGLELTHIDYHKGCYIGQETISRLKSVGHVNRQLRGFLTSGGEPLHPGARLFAPEDPARLLGTITSAAWSFALAKPIALGYLRRGSPDFLLARPAHREEPVREVTVCALPFLAT